MRVMARGRRQPAPCQAYAVLLWNHDSHKLLPFGATQREAENTSFACSAGVR